MWPFSSKTSSQSAQPAMSPKMVDDIVRYIPRNDDWSNFLTGLGYAGLDKRMSMSFLPSRQLTEIELNNLYDSEGLAWRGIEIFVEDMTKKPFTISGDPENKLATELKKIKAYPQLAMCIRWALLHGGAIGVIGIDDGGYLDEPVNEANIRSISHIRVFDRWRVVYAPQDLYSDPSNPNYGTTEWYTVFPIDMSTSSFDYSNLANQAAKDRDRPSMRNRAFQGSQAWTGSFRVHESRVLRFDGKPTPDRKKVENYGWNNPYLQGVYGRLKGLGEAYAGCETIVSEFMTGLLQIQGLAGMIAGGNESLAIKRLHMIDQSRHLLNTLLVDAEEEYRRDFANVTGLSQLMDTLILGVAAAFGIPVTRLMGQSPAGLNATGAQDMRMHYDKIASMQQAMMLDPCEKLVRYLMLSKESAFSGSEPKDWEIEFPSLYELTELEQATLRKTTAETDAAYLDRSVLDPHEVAISRFGGNKYSIETNIDQNRERVLPGSEDDDAGKTGAT